MPKLTLSVDDALYEQIQERAEHAKTAEPLTAVMLLRQALKFLPARGGRALLINGPDLDTLEALLGNTTVLNGQDLCRRVGDLASVSFGHVRLPMSPNQLEQLQIKAERQGKTIEQLLEEAAPRVYEQFFDLLPNT